MKIITEFYSSRNNRAIKISTFCQRSGLPIRIFHALLLNNTLTQNNLKPSFALKSIVCAKEDTVITCIINATVCFVNNIGITDLQV
jgi:hypothetical protein